MIAWDELAARARVQSNDFLTSANRPVLLGQGHGFMYVPIDCASVHET